MLPIFKAGHIIAVLDLDSPLVDRFDQTDVEGLQVIVDSLQMSFA